MVPILIEIHRFPAIPQQSLDGSFAHFYNCVNFKYYFYPLPNIRFTIVAISQKG